MYKAIPVALCLVAAALLCPEPGPGAPEKGGNPVIYTLKPMAHPSLDEALQGFYQGLQRKGWLPRRATIRHLDAGGDFSRLAGLARTAVTGGASLVFALTTPAAKQAVAVTDPAGVPLVYAAVTDPVEAGVVTSLEGSRTRATGVSDRYPVEEQVRLFALLRAGMQRAGIIFNPAEGNSLILVRRTEKALAGHGASAHRYRVETAAEVPAAAQKAAAENDCVIVNGDNLATRHLAAVAWACREAETPLFVGDVASVAQGAVASVSPNYRHIGLVAGLQAARILEGEEPGRIPSALPQRFDYAVNPRAARSAGLAIPPELWLERDLWVSRGQAGRP